MNKSNIANIILAIVVCVLLALLIKGVADKRQPSSLQPTLPQKEIDSLANEVDVKPEQIKEVVKFNTITHIEFKTKFDTIIQYKDKWNTVVVDNSVQDTVKVIADVRDSIAIVTHTEKKWFAGQERTYVSITNSNPNVHINNLKRFEIKTQPKNWAVGIGVNMGWNGKQIQPTIGVGVYKTIFNF